MVDLPTIVVSDTNLLINLIHVGRILLLGQVPGYRFVVPEEVVAEVTFDDHRSQLAGALAAGAISLYHLTSLEGLALFAELRAVLGPGEAACLAIAELNGWWVASDELRRFRREVIARLGSGRLLTTPGVYLLGLRAGVLTVAEADADKDLLANRRFVMNFSSFSELLEPGTE